MNWTSQIIAEADWLYKLAVLLPLVFARLGALIMMLPLLGGPTVPVRIRALLVFAFSLLVLPMQWHVEINRPPHLLALLVLVAGEVFVGLVMSLGIAMLLGGIQLAGQVIGQLAGSAIADVFNPALDNSISLYSVLLFYVAAAVFVVVGGHEITMVALLDSYEMIPTGQGTSIASSAEVVQMLTSALSGSFVLGIRVAAPATLALLVSTLIMGLIGRTLPQFNIFAVGFGMNSFVTFIALALSLSGIVWAFEGEIVPTLNESLAALRQISASRE